MHASTPKLLTPCYVRENLPQEFGWNTTLRTNDDILSRCWIHLNSFLFPQNESLLVLCHKQSAFWSPWSNVWCRSLKSPKEMKHLRGKRGGILSKAEQDGWLYHQAKLSDTFWASKVWSQAPPQWFEENGGCHRGQNPELHEIYSGLLSALQATAQVTQSMEMHRSSYICVYFYMLHFSWNLENFKKKGREEALKEQWITSCTQIPHMLQCMPRMLELFLTLCLHAQRRAFPTEEGNKETLCAGELCTRTKTFESAWSNGCDAITLAHKGFRWWRIFMDLYP